MDTSRTLRRLCSTRELRIRLARTIGPILVGAGVGRFVARCFRDVIPSRGVRIDTSSPCISAATKAALFWNMYESAESRLVLRHLRRDLDVIELGSSIGYLASLIRKRVHTHARLFCFEANPALVDLVRSNVALNAPSQHVRVENRAIAAPGVSSVAFTAGDRSDGGQTVATRHGPSVPAASLSELVAELELESYVMVADIEGAEAAFIFGNPAPLLRCQQLVIELHQTQWQEAPISVEDLDRRLVEHHGFTRRDRYGHVFVYER